MIDVEFKIFDTVATALRSRFDGIFVGSDYTDVPNSFPAVTLVEASNIVVQSMRTAQNIENGAQVMWEANVFSNKASGRKQEARQIMASLDEQMAALGFTRTVMNAIPNVNDATIYRLVARYTGTILPEGENAYRVYT